jgi:hypothetical protein
MTGLPDASRIQARGQSKRALELDDPAAALLTVVHFIVYPLAAVGATALAWGYLMTKYRFGIAPSGSRRAQKAAALALATCALLGSSLSPARADRCDDLAAQLKSQIEGLTVGKTAANVIYLDHPAAKQIRLGCMSKQVINSLYVASDNRKPSPAFLNLAASATAVVFTVPKSDTLSGVTRCMKRMGFFRGDDVKTRYRRLDMECTRTKNSSAISISRAQGE